MNMQDALQSVLNGTYISEYRGEIKVDASWMPLTAAEKKAVERCINRGWLETEWSYYPKLTAAGWQKMGTTMVEYRTAELQADIARELRPGICDTVNIADYNVEFYRELYSNPEMTKWDVFKLERQRIFDNHCICEARVQDIEQQIARLEIYA